MEVRPDEAAGVLFEHHVMHDTEYWLKDKEGEDDNADDGVVCCNL